MGKNELVLKGDRLHVEIYSKIQLVTLIEQSGKQLIYTSNS